MAATRIRGLLWLKKWTKQNLSAGAVAVAVLFLLFYFVFLPKFSTPKRDSPGFLTPPSEFVDLTLLRNAKEKGAFCLDGTLPGYHFQKGFGSGSNKWVLHIEGGGWCNSVESCSTRKNTALGSSNYMEHQVLFSGILNHDPALNPDFFNWNRVKIRYCDGASFAGHPENEFKNGTKLFFRGQLIWEAVMDELLSIGMSKADQALLSGCSAGGLAAMIHCDDFRDMLPRDAAVKCLADASFFLDVKDVSDRPTMQTFYQDVVSLQGVDKSLPKDCVAKMKAGECLFPHEIISRIKTPFFLVNPAYDFWQIQHVLAPVASDPVRNWRKCRLNLLDCSPSQMEVLQGFRKSLMTAISEIEKSKEGGIFIDSCFIHCQTWSDNTWHGPRIENRTVSESVGDWYFNRKATKLIDCPSFPCNPTCVNMDYTRPRRSS